MLRLYKSKLFPANEVLTAIAGVQLALAAVKVGDYANIPWVIVMMPSIVIAVILMVIVLLITGLAIGITLYRRFMDR